MTSGPKTKHFDWGKKWVRRVDFLVTHLAKGRLILGHPVLPSKFLARVYFILPKCRRGIKRGSHKNLREFILNPFKLLKSV